MRDLSRVGRRQQLARWCHHARILSLAGRVRDVFRDDLRILAYHRVLGQVEPDGFDFDLELISASAADFREQMLAVKREFVPMRFDQVIECLGRGQRLPKRAMLVTFDDGYDDNYRIAFPILRELDMSAMFFVSTGHIESGLPYVYDWVVHMICTTPQAALVVPELELDVELPASRRGRRECAAQFLAALKRQPALLQEQAVAGLESRWEMPRAPHPDCRPMTWEQLRQMREGGMEVGSHGVHHRMLAKLPLQLMASEVYDSRTMIEARLGAPADVISYPVGGFGAFDDSVEGASRDAGYRMACSYISGTNRVGEGSPYALRRLHVERGVDQAWFRGLVELPELFSYRTHEPTA